MTDTRFKIHPGEEVKERLDGSVLLRMRSGEEIVFTKEEWEEHLSEYEMDVPDMVDYVINEIKGREIVAVPEMIDYLLDIRVRAEATQKALKGAIKLWSSTLREDKDEG